MFICNSFHHTLPCVQDISESIWAKALILDHLIYFWKKQKKKKKNGELCYGKCPKISNTLFHNILA